MKRIMEVGDVFESKENEIIIVGIEPVLDYLNEIKNKILLHMSDGKQLELEVKSVRISNSPTDKKMLGICLGESIVPKHILLGATVYVLP